MAKAKAAPTLPETAHVEDPKDLVPFQPPGAPVSEDNVLKVLEEVTAAISRGESIVSQQEHIEALVHGQEGRAELINSLILTHDYGRLMRFLKRRHVLESELLESSERENLLPHEKLGYLEYIKSELKLLEGKVQSGATNHRDLLDLLKKIDYKFEVEGRTMAEKLSKMSPMAKELTRRIASKARKVSSDIDRTAGARKPRAA